jgi:predicted site-specific integrase-resolvase
MPDVNFFNQTEAADLLRVSERTLERWRIEGNGPLFRRFGRRIVYAETDLKAWADKRCFTSTSAIAATRVRSQHES